MVTKLKDVDVVTIGVGMTGAMLDAFVTLQQHRELKGMTARTLRSLWRAARLRARMSSAKL